MPMPATVHVRYFAALREALGPGGPVPLPEPPTVGALRDALVGLGGEPARVLARGRPVRAAVDQRMAEDDTPLHPNAEVAFFPPVTGG